MKQPLSNRMKKRMSRVGTTEFIPKNHRKHRRAAKRSLILCSINGQQHVPGTKVPNRAQQMEYTAGGSIKYHC